VDKLKINSNLNVDKVQKAKVNVGNSKQAGIEYSFRFRTNYEPGVGKIQMEGAVVYIGPADKVKKTLDMWKKDKKLPDDMVKEVYDYLLAKCNVQALVLGRDMGLPPQIKLPKVG
jgi:hypothetical protein